MTDHRLLSLLHFADSAFPTGGYANPTLTLCALAIRLADRVKREMQSAVTLAPAKRSTEEDW